VTFCATVFVLGAAVTVSVTTPPPSVTVLYNVVVLAGSVVLTVLVMSADFVMKIVCCSTTTVCVEVFVLRLLIVTASAVTVNNDVLVAKLVDKTIIVDGLRVVVLPNWDVEMTVVKYVWPAWVLVRVATIEVMVLVVVLALSDVVFVAVEVCVTKRVEPGWVIVDVLTKLATVALSVMVVVLAMARGTMAPRRTMRFASAVGRQDAVVVDSLVVVL
jgi:hypothetical protein